MDEYTQLIKDKLLKEYLENQLLFVKNTEYIKNKLYNLLIENNIKFQNITYRTKSYKSLKEKLNKNIIDGIKNDIYNLNDLSGVRIIFYNKENLYKFINVLDHKFLIESKKYHQI